MEREFDFAHSRGAAVLLTGYQTPAAIRRIGTARLASWLNRRKVRTAGKDADTAVAAAKMQHTSVPGKQVASGIVADLAAQLLALDERFGSVDTQTRATFQAHPQAEIIESMPGMGPILGAELIAAAGDLTGYANADRLASAAELVPVPRDSGRRSGNLHRPTRYSRKLRRVFYLSAQVAAMREGPNRDYYLKKRSEGTEPRAGAHRAFTPPRRCPLGPAQRQPPLPNCRPRSREIGLTSSLRVHRRAGGEW